jgi:hypothetical protein
VNLFRTAEFDDVPRITALLSEFYAKHADKYGIPFDNASSLSTVEKIVRHGVCLVGDTSCAGALIVPFPYNFGANLANVMFWYFQQAREVRIFDALVAACRKAGATHITASSHYPENTIARLYDGWGMSPVESLHCGSLLQVGLSESRKRL